MVPLANGQNSDSAMPVSISSAFAQPRAGSAFVFPLPNCSGTLEPQAGPVNCQQILDQPGGSPDLPLGQWGAMEPLTLLCFGSSLG